MLFVQFGRAAFVAAGLLLVLVAPVHAQQQQTLSGTIRDASTQEPLDGANVFIPQLQLGTATDSEGRYRLVVVPGTYQVRYTYVGYEPDIQTITLDRDVVANVALTPTAILDEVTVTGADESFRQAAMGVARLDLAEMEVLPTFMGEIDVARGLLLLPGVTSVGEGSGGINVRGGDVDQNLVLLDGSQVFYPTHLFGFFSAFNPDLVGNVTLYRGTVPARYGGRISSVLQVQQRDGDSEHLRVRGGVGLVASRLAVEGPIAGPQLTAILGARISYVSWLMQLANRADLKNSTAGYGDLSGRLSFQPNDRFQTQLSGYFSFDNFRFGADTTYTYDIGNASLRSSYAFSPTLSTVVEGALSTYSYGFESEQPETGFDFRANVQHLRVQPSIVQVLPNRLLEAGVSLEQFSIRPGLFQPLNPDFFAAIQLDDERGIELAPYVVGDFEFGRFRVETGLRYSHWMTMGPARVPVLDPDAPRGPGAIRDTMLVASGDVVASYGGIEPRLALRFGLTDDAALKIGFSRMRQNVHLMSNTTAPTPIDRWKLTDQRIRPQVGDQVALGGYGGLGRGYRLSVETYYRWIHDIVTYRPGASLLLNPFIAADLVDAEGRAYGTEFQLEKTRGRVTGQLAYTLSRAERRAFATQQQDQVNFGQWYPSDFDRPQDLALTLAFRESPVVTWGINFVYSSGRPITYPTGVYDLGDLVVPSYTLRNQARLPDYHRLDFSMTIEPRRDGFSRFRDRWTFAVYNAYMRRNAYSVFFRQRPNSRIPQAYRLSTLGSIFPSLTYAFEF